MYTILYKKLKHAQRTLHRHKHVLPVNKRDGLMTSTNVFRCINLGKVFDIPLLALVFLTREKI